MEITHVSDDVFLNKIASIIETINESLPQKTESVAVTANEELGDLKKENEMEEMTNEQFKIIIEAIIQIVKDNEKETAIKKIEALLNK